jgi:hypothetical protein
MSAAAVKCGLAEGPDAEALKDLDEARKLITALALGDGVQGLLAQRAALVRLLGMVVIGMLGLRGILGCGAPHVRRRREVRPGRGPGCRGAQGPRRGPQAD